MVEQTVHCRCGQAERQATANRDADTVGRERTVAPHTASCPIVLAQSLDEINGQIAEAETLVPMFGADEHEARLDEMRKRRDRLASKIASYGERGTVDPDALWYDGTSKITNRSRPRTTIGDES